MTPMWTRVKVTNISYNTDGDLELAKTLPQMLELDVDFNHFNDDPKACVSNAILDTTGYCVFGFVYEKKGILNILDV